MDGLTVKSNLKKYDEETERFNLHEKGKAACKILDTFRNVLSDYKILELYNAIVNHRLAVLPETGIEDFSDGYHTFNELYHHRAILFSVICNQNSELAWKSKKHSDGTMFNGMFIVGIHTPEGDVSYHYDINPYWRLFKIKEISNAPEWDGYTVDDSINRITSLGKSKRGRKIKNGRL